MDLTQTARDAAYIAVGIGVIGFQRAQVARNELKTNLSSTVSSAYAKAPTVGSPDVSAVEAQVKAQVEDVRAVVEAQLTEVRAQVHKLVGQVEDALETRLPEQVKAAVHQVRSILAA